MGSDDVMIKINSLVVNYHSLLKKRLKKPTDDLPLFFGPFFSLSGGICKMVIDNCRCGRLKLGKMLF